MATREKSRIDFASFAGLALAVCAIVGGLVLEKGNVRDILQYTAGLIVCGGTLGAVLLTSPIGHIRSAIGYLKLVFFERSLDPHALTNEVVAYATKARKQGIISLESDAANIANPFLRKAMNLAVDGTDIDDLKAMMEVEITQGEHHAEEAAKVFENGGGYSPTIGIIGAVLGLIQVMKNLENISEVGRGIAVAFVATVYGVALANIFLLPIAGKIRARAAADSKLKEMTLEGIVGMIEGSNPKLIKARLEGYLPHAASQRSSTKQTRAAA